MRDQRKSKGEKHAEKASDYRGITPDALWLLAENRFQNSKEFYESKKPAIKEQVLIPMQQICAALADRMEKIDDKICLVPTRMVSRIRRDTRFTKDKTLYREHVWITFMRPKKEFPCSPAFWFEITPQGYRFGVGFYCTTPQLMQAYRSAILEDPAAFCKAVKKRKERALPLAAKVIKRTGPVMCRRICAIISTGRTRLSAGRIRAFCHFRMQGSSKNSEKAFLSSCRCITFS